jgi:hypothetical protein
MMREGRKTIHRGNIVPVHDEIWVVVSVYSARVMVNTHFTQHVVDHIMDPSTARFHSVSTSANVSQYKGSLEM